MLQHFRTAQNYLSCMPTAGDHYNHGSHHANAAIVADLVTQRLLEAIPPSISDDPSALPSDLANAAHYQRTNSAPDSTRDAALLASMQEMMTLMRSNHSSTKNPPNNTRPNRNPRGRGNRPNDRPTGGRGRGQAPAPRQYCWSHGYCAHGSNLCNNPLPGHQVSATATTMQGGSTNNCFWITPA
jgi:hypothetical protein